MTLEHVDPAEARRLLRGHDFLPEEKGDIPDLYETEPIEADDKIIHLHYFVGACDWWIAEVNRDFDLGFGFCSMGNTDSAEWGYVSLIELEGLVLTPASNGLPLVVERDLAWTQRPFRSIDIAKEV